MSSDKDKSHLKLMELRNRSDSKFIINIPKGINDDGHT